MSSQPVEANVVLTSDNSQYDQSMQQSTTVTQQLGAAVDTLGNKLNTLAKSAGRKMFGVAAADIAGITAATTAYGAWENQMEALNTQAAVLNKNMTAQKATFGSYAQSVNSLRTSFGDTTAGAAALVQTLSKLGDNTIGIDKLANTFEKLGKTTQESPQALAQGLLQLQRTMGTSQRDTEAYANQLAVLSARSDASATSILQFANAIAPLGRMVNMSQTDILGWSNAFQKAGQDGYQASNVFGQMIQNIAYATQSGSPELAKYANLVGMTVQQFKGLGGSDQILRVFESINQQGPRAITTLNRMGLDGMRTVRTISAMAQQPGGIAGEIKAAQGADSGAIDRGSETAMASLTNNLTKLRAQLNETAEAFGKNFAPAASLFIKLLTAGAAAANAFMSSPMGKLAAWAVAAAAPIAILAGTILTLAKALAMFATVNQVINSGFAAGFKRQGAVSAATEGMGNAVLTERELGRTGWFGRGTFGAGAAVSRRIGYGLNEREGPGLMSRAAGWGLTGLGKTTGFAGDLLYEPGSSTDFTRRKQFFGAATARESFGMGSRGTPFGMSPFMANVRSGYTKFMGGAQGDPMFTTRGGAPMGYEEASRINKNLDQLKAGKFAGLTSDAEKMKMAESQASQLTKNARALGELEKSTMSASKGMGNLGRGVGQLAGAMTQTAGTAAKVGGGLLGKAGGAMASIGMNPYLVGGMAAMAAVSWAKSEIQKQEYKYTDYTNALNPYYQATGTQAPASAAMAVQSPAQQALVTGPNARKITVREAQTATAATYKPVNSALPKDDADAAMTTLAGQWAYLSKDPKNVQNVAMDLTSLYGRDKAQQMIAALDQGGSSLISPTTSMSAAANPGFAGGNPLTKAFSYMADIRKSSDTADILDRSFGATQAQFNYLSATSPSQAAKFRGGEYEKIVSGFAAASPSRSDTQATETFQKALAKNMFGIDISTEQAFGTAIPEKGGGLKEQLQEIFGDQGYLGQDKETRQKILTNAGISPGLTGDKAAQAYYTKMFQPPPTEKGDAENAATQIKDATKELFGTGGILGMASVKKALSSEGDPVAQYRALEEVTNKISASGMPIGQQIKYLNRVSNLAQGDPSMGSDLAQQGLQNILGNAQTAQTFMGRGQQFSQQTQVFQGMMTGAMGPLTPGQRDQEKQAYTQQVAGQYQYFQQMLAMQHQYDISRSRAQDDYHLQQTYQLHDFNLQRTRAESDFNRQQAYAVADYHRSVKRANYDYNLQRKQAQADFDHQLEVSAKQMAMSVYDIYKRVDVQRTSSAEWILSNAQDQLVRMQDQESNLKKLRREGLSDNAIQQLKLTDPNNAQQVQELVNELNPRLIRQYNQMSTERVKAAKALGQDPSDLGASETRRQFQLSQSRSEKAHDRSMRLGEEDFQRQMERQRKEFNRMMSRQDEDFHTATERQHDAYLLQMKRSADDLADVGREITGDFEDILTQSVNHLSGHARKQAEAVLKSYRHLKNSTSPVAVEMMTELAKIFGFEYKVPAGVSAAGGGTASDTRGTSDMSLHGTGGHTVGQAKGGVLPGWSPGTDDRMVPLSGGEAIMRPEWARAVGKQHIDQMNHDARHGGFWLGGTMPLANATTSQHSPSQYPFATWAGDLNYPGYADYGKPIVAFKAGIAHPFDLGSDRSYGRGQTIDSGNQSTLYAHMSKVVTALAGKQVQAGQVIGYVGDYGNTGSPPTSHLHFEIRGGKINLADTGGSTGGTGRAAGVKFSDVIKKLYPKAEAAAYAMDGAHPLSPGQISQVVNRYGRRVWHKLTRKYGVQAGSPLGEGHDLSSTANYGANAQGVWTALRASGFSKIQAAGIMGNMQSESGFDPFIVQGGGHSRDPASAGNMGYGLVQWTPGAKLIPYLHGHAPSVSTEVQALREQLQGKGSSAEGAAGSALGAARSVGEAARAFELQYERHAGGAQPARTRQAQAIYDKYAADGAIVKGAQRMIVGEAGPEAVIPLNARGADFMSNLMGTDARSVGMHGTPMRGGVHVYNTRIDKSTNFSGPITVQANDPNELLAKLQARQRVMALSRPALAGSAA